MSKFLENGIREIDFLLEDDAIEEIKRMWRSYMAQITPFPDQGDVSGRGIVMCGGGLTYFSCAWVNIRMLRLNGCSLPIELWYLGKELSKETISEISQFGVECKNFYDYTITELTGVKLKPLAIIHSGFKDILFLDADNTCLRDPSYLFDSSEYKKYGAVFWPDYWKTAKDNPIWQITESHEYDSYEQESGQLLVNKERFWRELNLALYFNEKSHIFHRMLLGDKDTFKFAWYALKSDFFMIPTNVATCGYDSSDGDFRGTTMIQHDFHGQICFLHRNLLKWDITGLDEYSWRKIKLFRQVATDKSIYLTYDTKRFHFYIDIDGDIEELFFPFNDIENKCLEILEALRNSDFYNRFLVYSHIRQRRYSNGTGDLF